MLKVVVSRYAENTSKFFNLCLADNIKS
jgi:hypothetical protein